LVGLREGWARAYGWCRATPLYGVALSIHALPDGAIDRLNEGNAVVRLRDASGAIDRLSKGNAVLNSGDA